MLFAVGCVALSGFLMPVSASAASHGSDHAGTYAGVFAGIGRTAGRLVDIEGFANWGSPGWISDYHRSGVVGGVLLGKKFSLGRAPFRIELDATFGDRPAKTDRLDPEGRDETAEARFRWITTARVGIEQAEGPVTIFMSGGAALAGVTNSVTDIDFSADMPPRFDPDDSFSDNSTELGWVLGLGVEAPLDDAWTLRLEGSYLDFGRSTYSVNRSGNNPCGPGGPRRPCPYKVENSLAIIRLAVIYRFGR